MLQAEHRYLHTKHMFQGPENFCVHHSRSFSALGDAASCSCSCFCCPACSTGWSAMNCVVGPKWQGSGSWGGRAKRSSLGCGRRLQSRRVQVVLSGATDHPWYGASFSNSSSCRHIAYSVLRGSSSQPQLTSYGFSFWQFDSLKNSLVHRAHYNRSSLWSPPYIPSL